MRKLMGLGAALALILALLVGGAVLTKRQTTTPGVMTMLRLSDCSWPCWIGIVPGETTIWVAKGRVIAEFSPLARFQLTSPPSVVWATLDTKPDLGVVYVTVDAQSDNIVDRIMLDFNSVYFRDRATVGDFHQLFGAPSHVALPSAFSTTDSYGLIYGDDQQGMVIFTLWRNAIGWDQKVTTVVFYANGQLPFGPSVDIRPWRGFRPLGLYYSRNTP
jgi:hypothetical protein